MKTPNHRLVCLGNTGFTLDVVRLIDLRYVLSVGYLSNRDVEIVFGGQISLSYLVERTSQFLGFRVPYLNPETVRIDLELLPYTGQGHQFHQLNRPADPEEHFCLHQFVRAFEETWLSIEQRTRKVSLAGLQFHFPANALRLGPGGLA
jgi:hypothetical protein